MRSLVSVLALALLLAGCRATRPETFPDNEERPRCTAEAIWLEGNANKQLSLANLSDSTRVKLIRYEAAIRDLRLARALYWAELEGLESEATKEKPIPSGRREALEIEIDRLSRQLEAVYLARPSVP